MKNNSLSEKGLSLSQAQSISNICFQRSREISNKLDSVNNFSKTFTLDNHLYVETQGIPLPSDTKDLLITKSRLHALQAFLMENIKAKDFLLKELKSKHFVYDVEHPEAPTREFYSPIELVDESYGWSQLTVSELNEFYEAEAFASHIGQFIHKGGKLDNLRLELPKIKTLDWLEIEKDKKTPLMVTLHHKSEDLIQLHEELAALHRSYEQRVNYFKAKVKNIVTLENARISKENTTKQEEVNNRNKVLDTEYKNSLSQWDDNYRKALHEFEELRQKEIEKVSSLRIQIDNRFQALVDELLLQLN